MGLLHPMRPGLVPGRAVWAWLLAAQLCMQAAAAQGGAAQGGAAQDDAAQDGAARRDAALMHVLAAPGGVGLMRHARAPDTMDAPSAQLGDCFTRHGPDDFGHMQARLLGIRLHAAGIGGAAVFAGPWCRTFMTAQLLALGRVTVLPALAAFSGDPGNEARQTAELRAFLDAGRRGPPRILVTYQANVAALTGISPATAEVVVLRPGAQGYEVAGRLRAR